MYDNMVLIFVNCVILVSVVRIVIIHRVGQKSKPWQNRCSGMHLTLATAIEISQPLSHVT